MTRLNLQFLEMPIFFPSGSTSQFRILAIRMNVDSGYRISAVPSLHSLICLSYQYFLKGKFMKFLIITFCSTCPLLRLSQIHIFLTPRFKRSKSFRLVRVTIFRSHIKQQIK